MESRRIIEVDPTPELGSFPKEASHASPRTFRSPVRPSGAAVAPAAPSRQGGPWLSHHTVLNGILWILRTGAPWRDLPERYGKWNTVYSRFKRWRRDGTWTRLYSTVLDEHDEQGKIDHDLWCIDGTVSRAARCAGGARRRNRRRPRMGEGLATEVEEPPDHALGYSRGGFSTKVHLLCDSQGTVVGVHATPGQRHESKAFEPTMQRVYLPRRRGRRRWPRRLAGDKGYSYPRIWRWLSRRRIGRVIPTRKDQPRDPNFDKGEYRKRNIIERVVGWSKECQRLLSRFDKLAVNYLAFWIIASLVRLL